ncbi:MAG: tRNA 2-thiouridine(34) synthase MnmA [Phycisphaerales bacterium]|jgi:tRNA-uridine 2-sulfurtransferase|nr:tRNA 2-thiouridine(34) synthase MnmA [Phycisphaerales bacterium]MBT7171206.1 tRNA 2-thiouridine(34) synthase MnmA [Phycisphaerales bacterium]
MDGQSVLLAMSGGVDSSVAAAMLIEAGATVTGVFMCLGTAGGEGSDRGCCSPQDAADARRVAENLGMDLHVLNLQDAFAPIIDYFLGEYVDGRTPNPCIRCNAILKFGRLVELADSLDIDFVATGHYARMGEYDGQRCIRRGENSHKDQSYALFEIPPKNLPRMLLPIGEIDDKALVRDKARQAGLNVADKPDSQEICFVENDDYVSLLADRAPAALTPGNIINVEGDILGQHEGYGQFTIGQRRGINVACGVPMYVTKIDPATGEVTIGTREQSCSLALTAERSVWHVRPPAAEFKADVQIRYNHRGAPATVRIAEDETFTVEFDEPIHAITPGQAAVVYIDDCLLGGGWIQ